MTEQYDWRDVWTAGMNAPTPYPSNAAVVKYPPHLTARCDSCMGGMTASDYFDYEGICKPCRGLYDGGIKQ